MAFENIIIGIGLLILGISSIYRVTIKNKAKEKELVFYHQLHLLVSKEVKTMHFSAFRFSF
jgi:hypothetical protein